MAKHLKEKIVVFLLIFLPICFLIFSYFWIDYGLFLTISDIHPFFKHFQWLISFRDEHRFMLANVYLFLVIISLGLQIYFLFIRKLKLLSIKILFRLALINTLFFSLAYPFLSKDLFTYLFSAKMVLKYHANPFVVPPVNFLPTDLWVSLSHNIESTYLYGPVALFFSLIPALIFSGHKFILNFLGYKLINAFIFYLTGVLLYKLLNKDKKVFSFWFFNPFLTIELLINSHNDLLMISLFVIAIYYLYKISKLKAWLAFVASVLTKYFSIFALPIMFLGKKSKPLLFKLLSLLAVVFLLLQKVRHVLGWYYSWAYMFLPLAKLKIKSWLLIYLIGFLLLLHYYPFLKWGFWGAPELLPFPKWLFFLFLGFIILMEINLNTLKKKIKFLNR